MSYQTPGVVYGLSAANIGSSLGYCLANINKYKSKTEFMKDFGYSCSVSGSLSYLLEKIPVFGMLLFVGGLGWATLKLYQNKTANNSSKLAQAGKITLNTATALGGGVSGALLGQILIPVPILGALIGGIIGGMAGSKGSQMVIDLLNKKKFVAIINKLEKLMLPQGQWEYTRDTLNAFGITNKYFISSVPDTLKQNLQNNEQRYNDIWITMCAMATLTLFYSEKDQKEMHSKENKDAAVANAQKSKKSAVPPEDQKCKLDDKDAEALDQQQEWPTCIEAAQQWLIGQDVLVLDYMPQLTEFVRKIITDV